MWIMLLFSLTYFMFRLNISEMMRVYTVYTTLHTRIKQFYSMSLCLLKGYIDVHLETLLRIKNKKHIQTDTYPDNNSFVRYIY